MPSMGGTIRGIRKRLGKSQQEFAELLGCRHNTVSRYELDRFVPGTGPLVRLYDLALPHEKHLLAEEIKHQMGTAIVGREATLDASIEELRPFLNEMASFYALVGRLPRTADGEFRSPEQFIFAKLAVQILHTRNAVDPSINELLDLWFKYGNQKKAIQHFRDAAGFLRVQLAGLGGAAKRRREPRPAS